MRRNMTGIGIAAALVASLAIYIAVKWLWRTAEPVAARPNHWAAPLELAGVPNLHRVSDRLYRGAQPTAEGVKSLHALGVKTIVNLRDRHSDVDEIGETPIGYENITIKTWGFDAEDARAFLKIVTDDARSPVFVHCQHGSDRTGTMCAVYRIVVEGWNKEDAIAELVGGDFGYHEIWKNLTQFLRELDVAALKKELENARIKASD